MVNSRQMESIIKQLTDILGREPYSTELLAAINGNFPKKES